jgi:hypothetical protein
MIAGWREFVTLPDLQTPVMRAKLDTGALTSCLDARSIEAFWHEGVEWVQFNLATSRYKPSPEVLCRQPILERRDVRDSGGHQSQRIVIKATLQLGDQSCLTEFTLADRQAMQYRVLLGRRTLTQLNLMVDAKSPYRLTRPRTEFEIFNPTNEESKTS